MSFVDGFHLIFAGMDKGNWKTWMFNYQHRMASRRRRVNSTVAFSAAITVLCVSYAWGENSQIYKRCANVIANPKVGMAACTDIIENKRVPGPLLATVFFDRGLGAAKEGHFKVAVRDYNKAIKLDPKNAHFFNARGYAYHRLGNKVGALADYDRAIALNQVFVPALVNRAQFFLEVGKTKKAFDDVKSAIRIDAKYAPAFRTRGTIRRKWCQWELASADFQTAILLNPRDGAAYFERGLLHERRHKRQAALNDFRAALVRAPNHRVAAVWRATLKVFLTTPMKLKRMETAIPLPRPRLRDGARRP